MNRTAFLTLGGGLLAAAAVFLALGAGLSGGGGRVDSSRDRPKSGEPESGEITVWIVPDPAHEGTIGEAVDPAGFTAESAHAAIVLLDGTEATMHVGAEAAGAEGSISGELALDMSVRTLEEGMARLNIRLGYSVESAELSSPRPGPAGARRQAESHADTPAGPSRDRGYQLRAQIDTAGVVPLGQPTVLAVWRSDGAGSDRMLIVRVTRD